MQALRHVTATPEQLPIISRTNAGTEVIRGAAGSGKTTTALLRLSALVGTHANRKLRMGSVEPVRVLVLTYNRTLRGYIEALVRAESRAFKSVSLSIETFGHWSWSALGEPTVLEDAAARAKIEGLGKHLPLQQTFLSDEVEYLLGRFRPESLDEYITCRRVGRGRTPRVDGNLRQQILAEVVQPYSSWKLTNGLRDWNDISIEMSRATILPTIDIAIVDEAQDFSANQVRAILPHLAETNNLTFVLDAAQRIYARGFTWEEVGVTVTVSHKLNNNYRNTIEIARFAASLLDGLTVEDDGSLPNFKAATKRGELPRVLKGKFSAQMSHALKILNSLDLENESVAFLLPRGGAWFDHIRKTLAGRGYGFIELSRQSEWPDGDENIALCTMNSAKGLEFDHVFILGLSAETMAHGEDMEDDRLGMYRRLLAMAIGRARQTVTLGYKPGEAARLIEFLDEATYEEVIL